MSQARYLRKNATPSERILWRHLRNRTLSGHKFRRQHPIDRYVLDFYCPEARLAIELDGGQHAEDGAAAYVMLASTHERALDIVPIEVLREHAVDVPADPGWLIEDQ